MLVCVCVCVTEHTHTLSCILIRPFFLDVHAFLFAAHAPLIGLCMCFPLSLFCFSLSVRYLIPLDTCAYMRMLAVCPVQF
ncbi:hypothetical protein EON63_10645 [archaeon]|nr:MAG: hypothetical protein EON63_10645 [archaeon]